MGKRMVAGAAALGVAVGVAVVGVLVARGGDEPPAPLPVLAGDRGESAEPADAASSLVVAPVEYQTDGSLDDLGGEAFAWELGQDADLDRIAALAGALGLGAEVVETASGWEVVDGDRRLDVARQPGLPWSYSATGGSASGGGSSGSSGSSGSDAVSGGSVSTERPDEAVTSDAEEPTKPGTVDPSRPGETIVCEMPPCPPGTACVQVCPPPRPEDLPSGGEAEEIAGRILAAGGLDLDEADVRVEDQVSAWLVSADPVVGGLPTVGMGSVVSVGGGGDVVFANGWLADPQRGDAYPLVGSTEALRRLQANQPVALDGGREPAVGCEGCLPTEPVVVTVTGVRLGLQLAPAAGADQAWLVPAYLFEIDGGGPGSEVVALAVADEFLTAPSTPKPEPLPLPEPDPGRLPEPDPAEPPVMSGASCAAVTAASEGGGAAQPPTLEVCADGPARAGETVVFELTATDPDSAIRDDCGSPVIEFGDEGDQGVAVCDIGCISLPPGPGELRRIVEHVYAQPGNYEATFSLTGCEPDYATEARVSLPVTVAP